MRGLIKEIDRLEDDLDRVKNVKQVLKWISRKVEDIEHKAKEVDSTYTSAPNLQIVTSLNPSVFFAHAWLSQANNNRSQLAVVRGFVQERMQVLKLEEMLPAVEEGDGPFLPHEQDYQNFIRASSASVPSLRATDNASTKYSDSVAHRMDQMSIKQVEEDDSAARSLSHVRLNPSESDTASHFSIP